MTDKNRCRAKKPQECWKHGTGLGFDANRKIRDIMKAPQVAHTSHEIFKQPLKTYDGYQMASLVTAWAGNTKKVNRERVRDAIKMASDLHKVDTRANRAHHDRTPYIEHPLRNAMRVIRWGTQDEATVIAGILHDTVEDHPFEIARKYAKKDPKTEQEAREIAYEYIGKKYGKDVADTVKGMSNPINEDRYMPAAQKNANYREHVNEATDKSLRVLVDKASDLTDNALSLHHTEKGMSSISLYKKSTKYIPVVEDMVHKLKKTYLENNSMPIISQEGLADMINQLESGLGKLRDIQTRHTPAEKK
jgi:(p)ppGpp synthase/HD superfamily hydrolase